MGLCEAPPNKLPLKKQVPSVKEAGEVAPPNPPMPFCSGGKLLCSAADRPGPAPPQLPHGPSESVPPVPSTLMSMRSPSARMLEPLSASGFHLP